MTTNPNNLPKVIFFDAMGTLFKLKTSVGSIYQQYASKYGVRANDHAIEQAFFRSFKSAPSLAFSPGELAVIKEQEFNWWQQVVAETFIQLNLLDQFSNFTDFFSEIYAYFSTGAPWCLFPDTVTSLQKWQDQGVELGVISNFDSRLLQVLTDLNLSQFFTSITISSLAGFAKPNVKIFKIALAKHQIKAAQAWHVGDSLIEDYHGARNAEINSFWLNQDAGDLNLENQLPNLSSLG
ncbi:MAG: HAD-IA family hydrolase [Cyanobacteria bacterium J06621_8]